MIFSMPFIHYLLKEFDLIDRELEMVVSFLYLGSGLGALLGGQICDEHGENFSLFECFMLLLQFLASLDILILF